MAVAIVISTFGCNNGLILAGARAYYAMARDGLFFRSAGRLNDAKVPAWGLVLQGLWAVLLVLPRTYNPATRAYGNLYSNLLDYVISAALIFYILTIAGALPAATDPAGRRAAVSRVRLPDSAGGLHRGRQHHPARAVRLSNGDDLARVDHRAAGGASVFRLAPEIATSPSFATVADRAPGMAGARPAQERTRSGTGGSPRCGTSSDALWDIKRAEMTLQ